MLRLRVLCGVLLALSAVSCAAPVAFTPAYETGVIRNRAVTECSGMAPSRRYDDVIWMLNDSGNEPAIYAVGSDGRDLATVHVQGVNNRDWEDMASFKLDGQSFLAACEVGDNNAVHPTCKLYIVPEPAPGATTTAPAWTIRFRYEDGPRDCESIAVDAKHRRILLLTKRDRPPVLYDLPLWPDESNETQTARRIGEVLTMPPAPQGGSKWLNMPTAMDLSADGRLLTVLNYHELLVYERGRRQSWFDALAHPPTVLALPKLDQMEAACFSRDGRSIYVSTERLPAPILRLDLVR